ncbi:MAG: hypothetical protein ACD_75C02594G0001 [uncultured bacterium]|nr:MAG: hypothetical protein ACD_75C02594G0001 [uncultured bacterium]
MSGRYALSFPVCVFRVTLRQPSSRVPMGQIQPQKKRPRIRVKSTVPTAGSIRRIKKPAATEADRASRGSILKRMFTAYSMLSEPE